MDEGSSEKGSVESKRPEIVEGKGFVMKPSLGPANFNPRTSVEMRSGATNEEALKKIAEERARIARMTPGERKALEEENLEEEARKMAVEFFDFHLKHRSEYSETLIVGPNGNFDRNRRLNDQYSSPPYIVNLFDLSQPQDLYKLMKKNRRRKFPFKN